jgi:GNAT superfamily N-acetyltransferase
MSITLRNATLADLTHLRILIAASVRGLQSIDYTAAEIQGALATVYGVDTQLIADGTYFVAEAHEADSRAHDGGDEGGGPYLVGCGGWSKRATLFGGDQYAGREDALLDPERDAAKIRAFFVHPEWARRGVGTRILDACERAAIAAGFHRLEMGATLTGVPFYAARGYAELGQLSVPLPDGASLAIVRMGKTIP